MYNQAGLNQPCEAKQLHGGYSSKPTETSPIPENECDAEKAQADATSNTVHDRTDDNSIASNDSQARKDSYASNASKVDLEEKEESVVLANGIGAGLGADAEQPNKDLEAGNILHRVDTKPFSVFTDREKKLIVLCAGFCAFFSPISGQIYFPSLDVIAKDLGVSNSQINLTITVYLVGVFISL